jgi:hypothetical protein
MSEWALKNYGNSKPSKLNTPRSLSQMATISEYRYRWLRVRDLNLRRLVRTIARPRRAQLSIRRDRRNYDRSIAGLGTDKA